MNSITLPKNPKQRPKMPAIFEAIVGHDLNTLKDLLKDDQNWKLISNDGLTPFMTAIQFYEESIPLFLQYPDKIDWTALDSNHENALCYIVGMISSLELVKDCVKAGALVVSVSKNHIPPLFLAAELCLEEIFEYLLYNGAAPNTDEDWSELYGVLDEDLEEIIEQWKIDKVKAQLDEGLPKAESKKALKIHL